MVWKDFLKECLDTGDWVIKDDGDDILEILDNHCFIPNVLDSVMINSDVSLDKFLDLIGKGVFDIDGFPFEKEMLKGYVVQLDDPKQIYFDINSDSVDCFVYNYPERLFNIHQVTRDNEILDVNQIETIINRLKESKGSNRGVANLYMCALDRDEKDIPCLQFVQCLIRNDELSLHVLFRSNDLYSAFPSNMLFLTYLALKITKELKDNYPLLKFKGIYYNSTSLHIYKGDYEQAKKVFED